MPSWLQEEAKHSGGAGGYGGRGGFGARDVRRGKVCVKLLIEQAATLYVVLIVSCNQAFFRFEYIMMESVVTVAERFFHCFLACVSFEICASS